MSLFSAPNPPQYNPRTNSGRTVPLQTAATAPFNAGGAAQVTLGPSRAGQSWHVTRMSSLINPGILPNVVPQLWVYRNSAVPSSLIDSTTSADQATSETDFLLLEGERLLCNWQLGGVTQEQIISTNYFEDPFFHNATVFGGNAQGTVAVDNTFVHQGNSILLTNTAGTQQAQSVSTATASGSAFPALKVGDVITWSGWVYVPGSVTSTQAGALRMQGTAIATIQGAAATKGSFVRQTISATVTTAGGTVQIYVYGGLATGEQVWWSTVSLKLNDTNIDDFSGDTTPGTYSYRWLGTPYGSPSQEYIPGQGGVATGQQATVILTGEVVY